MRCSGAACILVYEGLKRFLLLSIVQDESLPERSLSPTQKEVGKEEEEEEEAEPVISKKLGTTRQLSGDLGTSSGQPPVSPARSIPRSGKLAPIQEMYCFYL